MTDRIFQFLLRYPVLGLLLAIILGTVGILNGRGLPIRLSLADLLPSDRESVRDLKEVARDFGGTGYVAVIVGPVANPLDHIKPLVPVVQAIPEIRYTFFERESYTLRNFAPYILPSSEFDDLLRYTELLLNDGKAGGFLDLGFQDTTEQKKNIEEAEKYFESLRQKYLGSDRALESDQSRYFVSQDGSYALLWAKPTFDSEDIAMSRKLVTTLKTAVGSALPPEIPFRLWGRSVNNVRDTDQIQADIKATSIFSLALITLILIMGLGSVRAALLCVTAVSLAMGANLGIAAAWVGQINLLTGFLLAILGGLGVEYGIHLCRRYFVERRTQLHAEALSTTYMQLGRALLSAALTSSGAFLLLSFSDFRGFSELGKIAGTGVMSIYIVYMLCFPAFGWVLKNSGQRFKNTGKVFGFYPVRKSWGVLLVPLAIILVVGIPKAEFELNFERMRELSKDTLALNKIVFSINNYRSTVPAVFLTTDKEQEKAVTAFFEENLSELNLQQVVSQSTLLNEEADLRFGDLEKFRRQTPKISDAELEKKTGIEASLIRSWVTTDPPKFEDLPLQLRETFGNGLPAVLVYTNDVLHEADGIRNFTNTILKVKEMFPGVKVGSDARIFNEILDHVITDGRIVMLLFIAGCFFLMWGDFRNVRGALSLTCQLVLGLLFLVAFMGLFGVPFSILNVSMIPAVLAAGIDMGVHVRHHELEKKSGALAAAKSIASAVQLGAVTTMIGFGALFLAEAKMLNGIAWISVLGQISMYLVCMVIWPLSKDLLKTLRVRKRTLDPAKH